LLTHNYLIRNASINAFWRGLGVISGTILDAAILAYFGLSGDTDALFAGLAIPYLLTSALDLQAPKILVPVLTRRTEEAGEKATVELVRILVTTFGVFLCAASLLLAALAHILMPLQAPGLQPGVIQLSVQLFQLLIWLTLFQGLAPILQSFLYTRHRYLVPSLGRVMTTCPAILVVVLYHEQLGIYAAAIGLVLGSIVYLLLLTVTARSQGLDCRLLWRPRDETTLRILKMFGNPVCGHALAESKLFAENFLASFLGGGALTVLRYASRIVEAISGVLLGGIVTSSLPLVSGYASEKDLPEMKRSIRDAVRLIAFVALPISCWLIFAGQPMIALLFERGRFSPEDSALTAALIALLTPYIIFGRIIGITQTPFYARLDTRTPLLSIIMFFALYVVTVLYLADRIGIYGFPLASSFACVMTALTMSFLLHRAFGPLGWKQLKPFGLRMALVMILTICAFSVGHVINAEILADSLTAKWIRFLVPTALGSISFLAASVIVGLLGKRHLQALVNR
jgi:putative peptidoglycan lipid II flippase